MFQHSRSYVSRITDYDFTHSAFDIPRRPLKRRLVGLPSFVVTRGGEYCFLPGIRAMKWIADLK